MSSNILDYLLRCGGRCRGSSSPGGVGNCCHIGRDIPVTRFHEGTQAESCIVWSLSGAVEKNSSVSICLTFVSYQMLSHVFITW